MDITQLAELINRYGFPIIAAGWMLRMVKFVWDFVINEINPVLVDANKELISLIDKIRLVDADCLRITAKLNTVLQMRENISNSTEDKK